MPPAPSPLPYHDGFTAFDAGVNSGVATSLLQTNELAFSLNTTERGGYVTNRPAFRKITLDYASNAILQTHFEGGRWQGAGFYKSDSGRGSLLAAIGGRLFNLPVAQTSSLVQEVTVSAATAVTNAFVVPAVNGTVAVDVADTTNIPVGSEILIGTEDYTVISITSPTQLVVQNIDDTPGNVVAIGTILTFYDLNPSSRPEAWIFQGEKWAIVNDGQSVPIIFDGASAFRSSAPSGISAGKMGAYWQGRLWWVNPDGRTYRAGDLVYSSSGTGDKRNAILQQTQNTYLNTGGNFTIPANAGQITAMRPVAVLDNSLGQGPLQVCTATMIFGNTASTDSTTWQNTNSTIQGVSLIDVGPLGQNSTVLVNGDMFYRSEKGVNTLIMGRREFQSWGNTPISSEMTRVIVADEKSLLAYGSAVVFDNRMLMTSGPTISPKGVYHRGIMALDFHVISSMRDKKPPVWDSTWTAIRPLQLVVGNFSGVQRCFAFSLTEGGTIELWEILPMVPGTPDNNFDQNETPIVWTIEAPEIFRKEGIGKFQKSRLMDGEMFIDQLQGFASVQVFFKPGQGSCWIPWTSFSICAKTCDLADNPYDCLAGTNFVPQYRDRLGFGEPTAECNPNTNCPWREAWTFQIKIVVQGTLRIKGLKFTACKVDEPEFAIPMCQISCNPITFSSKLVSAGCDDGAIALIDFGASLGKGAYIDGIDLVLPAAAFTSTISQSVADAAAQAYIQSLFDANIAANKLLCLTYDWELCSGSMTNSDSETVLWSDCADAPETFDYGADGLKPTLDAVPTDCGLGPINAYVCTDVTVQTTELGPFNEDKVITVNGIFQVDMTHYLANPCGDQGSVSISAYLGTPPQFGSLFSVNYQMSDVPVSGTFTITGTLTAGLAARVFLVITADVQGDPALTAPPVIQLAVSEITVT